MTIPAPPPWAKHDGGSGEWGSQPWYARGDDAAFKAAIEADKAKKAEQPDDEAGADEPKTPGGAVSFFQRAVPLLELLERSLKDKVPVTWGV